MRAHGKGKAASRHNVNAPPQPHVPLPSPLTSHAGGNNELSSSLPPSSPSASNCSVQTQMENVCIWRQGNNVVHSRIHAKCPHTSKCIMGEGAGSRVNCLTARNTWLVAGELANGNTTRNTCLPCLSHTPQCLLGGNGRIHTHTITGIVEQ